MSEPREHTAEERARTAVAEQLRRMSHELVRGDHAVDELWAMAERLRGEADTLAAPGDRVRDFSRFDAPAAVPVPADGEEFFNSPDRAVSGVGHPYAVPLRVFRQGDRAVTDVTLELGFQGAPGMAHGGFVAAIFDDLLGYLMMLQGTIAFTAYLTVNYKIGTPIGEPLRFEAWIDRVEGKKLFLAGECRNDADDVLTTCEALFIDASAHFAALAGGS